MSRMSFVGLVLVLAAQASASRLFADLAVVTSDAAWAKNAKESPIARVVNLLKDMQSELTAEMKADEEMFDKLMCWCETNDKEKTKAIADAKQLSSELTAAIEENTALGSTREVEIGSLSDDVAALEKGLEEAAALRAKETAEFNQNEKDLIQSIASLKGAVNTLSKTQSSALVQQEALVQVAQVLRRRPGLRADVAPHQRAQFDALLRQPREMSLLQQSSNLNIQDLLRNQDSGAIFGILQQMKETFETNMENGKKEEAQGAADYASLKATKEEELKASSDKLFTKKEELAKAKETVANAKEDLQDTTATLEADTTFLADLKTKCEQINNEWDARQKMRAEEITAVGETIGILTSDDAKDTMSAAGTFIQARALSRTQTVAREKTADHLAAAGKMLHSPRLSYLAVRVRNDAFAKVKESIGGMVNQLGVEQKDEVVKKDGCVTDFNTNEKQTTEKNDHKQDVETDIAGLEAEITEKTEEEKMIKQQMADAQVELKKASENREQENKVFQQTIADQQATQAILKKALDRMSKFYAKKAASSAAFLQRQAEELRRQTPPGSFAPIKKNGGGTGVIAMLETIIDESKETEEDALKAENDAQAAYEEFVKNTNTAIEAMSVAIVNDDEVIAEDKKKEVSDEADKRSTDSDILTLASVEGTLHEACDFTVDHFTERQEARGSEMDALKQAEAIFSKGR